MADPVTPNHPPSLLEFVKANQPLNPHLSTAELAKVWDADWGHVDPKTLPSLDTFIQKNKPLNPEMSDEDLSNHWHDYYGSLGADGPPRPITTRKDRTRGRLNTADAPDPLILPEEPMLPEDPDDLLPDPDNLERWMEAGIPLDVIDRRMDSFFGRASASIAPSTPRMLTPKARNNPPTNLTPRSGVPHLNEFLTVAGPDNPHKSTRELAQYWNQTYGPVDPKTLPSLETFLPAAREDNPGKSDHELTSYWGDRYGALGAPEKNSVAPAPGLLGTAKEVGRQVVAGAVTGLSKMTGQATAAQTRR